MRHLYLLRHAKSSWSDPSLEDFDRPLAPRGHHAAARIGQLMHACSLAPSLVLCSSARRTVETWQRVAPHLGAGSAVELRRSLYEASPDQLLNEIRGAPGEASPLLVIGHNPGLEQLALLLAGPGSSAAALKQIRRKFPTAALAVLACDIDRWADLGAGRGRLTCFHRARDP